MRLRRILSEPLLHFLAAGLFLFMLFSYVNQDVLQSPNTIIVDAARVNSLREQFRRTWLRPPTHAEIQGLVNAWIREEVLYREGLAMGLGADDPVIRRRIGQSLEFVSDLYIDESVTENEIRTWFEDHQDQYVVEPVLTFEQLYLDPSVHREDLDSAIASAREALQSGATEFVGDRTMLPRRVADATVTEVARIFGDGFADTVSDLAAGRWTGPVESGFGLHFVRIESRTASRTADFAEVRDAIERDLVAARREAAKEAQFQALLSRYIIEVPESVIGDAAVSGAE